MCPEAARCRPPSHKPIAKPAWARPAARGNCSKWNSLGCLCLASTSSYINALPRLARMLSPTGVPGHPPSRHREPPRVPEGMQPPTADAMHTQYDPPEEPTPRPAVNPSSLMLYLRGAFTSGAHFFLALPNREDRFDIASFYSNFSPQHPDLSGQRALLFSQSTYSGLPAALGISYGLPPPSLLLTSTRFATQLIYCRPLHMTLRSFGLSNKGLSFPV